MKKSFLLRGAMALCLVLSLSFSLMACSAPAGKAPEATPTPVPALTEEEYMTKLEELGTKMLEVQTNAAAIDPTDLEAAKKLLADMKAPFVDFVAITPPEKYADAHAKLQSGCNGMIEYVDIIIQITEEPDATKQQELATKMVEALTTASTDITEGGQMLADLG